MPELAVAAIDRVAGHPAGGHASVKGALEHLARQPGLGRKGNRVGDSGRLTTLGLLGPRARQIQRPVQEGTAAGRVVGEQHPDLAVLDPARSARVLTLHARALCALLEKPSLIHDQHTSGIAELVDHVDAQIIPHLLSVPAGTAQQMLHAIGRPITGLLG